jgi:hypothetical protein
VRCRISADGRVLSDWSGHSDYIDALHVIDLAKYKSADSSKAIDGNFYRAHLIGGF